MTHPRGRTGRAVVMAALVTLALLAGGLTTAGARVAPRSGDGAAPVADEVRTQLAASGQASFWVRFEGRPRLGAAAATPDWGAQGRAVVAELEANAADSQAGVRRLLTDRGIDFTAFWAVNAIRTTAGADVVDLITAEPDVTGIDADRSYALPEPIGGDGLEAVDGVEWNVDRVGAPEVWSELGTRGEGIVVGSIDSGVQFDHPALVRSYRGNLGGGVFDHAYDWYDPSAVCGDPSAGPCDNLGHGTHTMGTMVGDDGAGNQTGVAPGARWITAKGCEANSCSREALVASAQWMLAPTDAAGANPRPDLRPNVVNNSWGGGTDPFLQEVIDAWVAAGIFPVFSNGNSGPWCGSTGSPADYPSSYSVGAFDRDDAIAPFSTRGPGGLDGSIKPDISAPGVNVRSTVPGDGYEVHSGTSMAAPHVAATVALMWSAAPAVAGDVEATRELLDQTATDRPDLSCGGTPGNNNVWGEGAIDAFAAVDQSPTGATGTLAGLVTEEATGAPLVGVRVHVAGRTDRVTETAADGTYGLTLEAGDYAVDLSAYAYATVHAEATVTDGAVTTLDAALAPAPRHVVRGTVTDHLGAPVEGVSVSLLGTPVQPQYTAADGTYSILFVPEGTYTVEVRQGRCLATWVRTLTVDGNETLDVTLRPKADEAGYTCQEGPADYVEADTVVPLFGMYEPTAIEVALPFDFPFYGERHDSVFMSSSGYLSFTGATNQFWPTPIPSPSAPNAAIFAFGEELWVTGYSAARSTVLGEAPHRQFVLEWRNVSFAWTTDAVSFELLLSEDGDIEMRYRDIGEGRERGSDAVVGIENATGDDGLQYSFAQSVLHDGLGVHVNAPPAGSVEGRVTDSADGTPVVGADVRALVDGTEVQSATTAGNGWYLLRLPPGTYTVEVALNGQGVETATVVVEDISDTERLDVELSFGRIGVAPAGLELTVPAGQTRQRTIAIANEGRAPLDVEIHERPVASGDGGRVLENLVPYVAAFQTFVDVPWLRVDPTAATVAPGTSRSWTVTVDTTGLAPGFHRANLIVDSSDPYAGRVLVPVTVHVPAFQVAVDAGAGGPFTDAGGDTWAADRSYSAGGWGYTGAASTRQTTGRAIAGTDEDRLFQTARSSPGEYRFDGLPAGTYEVDLRFAETNGRRPGRRSSDVYIEGTLVLPSHDISEEVGTYAADRHPLIVEVTDGQLNVGFVARAGFGAPIVNGLRVTHRPDL